MRAFRFCILIPALALCAAAAPSRPWTDEVMYFVMADRFHDGDPENNRPPGSDPTLFDPRQRDISRYLGYWAQDWLDIDPHLTSRVSLAGEPYSDDADGRMSHYRDFVKLANSKGIRVVQDVVLNHAGPVFYYDVNGNGVFDTSGKDEWVQPFKRDGYHDSAHFDELVDEFVAIHHFYLTTVGVDGLRIDTVKHAHHEFWDAFTERLRARLGPAAADKLLFGEIYDGNPAVLGRYTWRSDWPQSAGPCLDSVLDFQFCFSAREYLRHRGNHHGTAHALERALLTRNADDPSGRPYYNPNPGPDGLNSVQKMITFIENHDGLNRFRVAGVTESRNRLAQGLVMTLPGIPCLYYGTEFALHDTEGNIDHDSETGRMMFFRRQGGPTMREVRESKPFAEIAALATLRAELPALRRGGFAPLWVDSGEGPEDDGVFAFARHIAGDPDFAVVVINASDEPRVTGTANGAMRLPAPLESTGRTLEPVLTIGRGPAPDSAGIAADGMLRLPAPPSSLVVWRSLPAPAK